MSKGNIALKESQIIGLEVEERRSLTCRKINR